MPVSRIMDLFSRCGDEEKDAVKAKAARGGGDLKKLGKWLVPQTKHYSWLKAADIAYDESPVCEHCGKPFFTDVEDEDEE